MALCSPNCSDSDSTGQFWNSLTFKTFFSSRFFTFILFSQVVSLWQQQQREEAGASSFAHRLFMAFRCGSLINKFSTPPSPPLPFLSFAFSSVLGRRPFLSVFGGRLYYNYYVVLSLFFPNQRLGWSTRPRHHHRPKFFFCGCPLNKVTIGRGNLSMIIVQKENFSFSSTRENAAKVYFWSALSNFFFLIKWFRSRLFCGFGRCEDQGPRGWWEEQVGGRANKTPAARPWNLSLGIYDGHFIRLHGEERNRGSEIFSL